MESMFGGDGLDEEHHDLPSDIEGHGENEDDHREGGDDGDEANGDQKPIKVEPKKRSVRNPRPRLTLEILQGPRGIHTIENYFKDVKFKGKGHEKQDLDEVLRRLQHWAHRLYPNYKFDDVLTNIERLGKKKSLQVHMSRYRLGMLENMRTSSDEANLGVADDDEDGINGGNAADEPFDEFDALLGEQIAISKLAPRTPAANTTTNSNFTTPSFTREKIAVSTPFAGVHNINDSDLAQPLPLSQPSSPAPAVAADRAPTGAAEKKELTAEQLARMAENRRLAMERLKLTKARFERQATQQENNQATQLQNEE